MHPDKIKKLLLSVQKKEISINGAMKELRTLPFKDLGFAKVDTHRSLRQGFPEVIYCEGKKIKDIISIFSELVRVGENIVATRANKKVFTIVKKKFPKAKYHEDARIITIVKKRIEKKGLVVIISAGTADIPVAEEARVSAEAFGAKTKCLYDVGIAGIHRLFAHTEWLYKANVIVVVAGMEGALPSVVGGLTNKPVIAVPTSVGYGASFGGLAPLLTMLNSCAAGVLVTNIDNGFGAGYSAGMINKTTVS